MDTFLAAAITVLVGVCVFVVGQVIVRLFLEPVQELRLEIGRIAESVIFFANVLHNPYGTIGEREEEASNALRRHAGTLTARGQAILGYSLMATLHLVPPWSDLRIARDNLIALSNISKNVRDSQVNDMYSELGRALRLKPIFKRA